MKREDDPRERLRILGEAFIRLSDDESAFEAIREAIRAQNREAFDEAAWRFIPKWLERAFWCFPIVTLVGNQKPTWEVHYTWTATGAELTPAEVQRLKSEPFKGKTLLQWFIDHLYISVTTVLVEPLEKVTGELCISEVNGEGPSL